MSDLKNPISAVDQLRGVRGDQPPVARNPSISVGAFQRASGRRILTLSPTAPCAPPCPTALGLIGPRKKEKKTGFDDVS